MEPTIDPANSPNESSAEINSRIERAVAGDRDTLLELLLDCQRELGVFVSSLVGRKDQSQINEDDILQETFIDAFRGVRGLRARDWDGFVGWVKSIAQHRLLDTIRKRNALKRGGNFLQVENIRNEYQSQAVNLVNELSCHENSPSQHVARNEAIEAVQVAIAQLPDDYRNAIQYHCFERLSLGETAERMGRSLDSVRGLIQRAKDALRESLHKSTLWLSRK